MIVSNFNKMSITVVCHFFYPDVSMNLLDSLSLLNGKWFSLMCHCMISLLCLFASLFSVGGLSESKLNGVIGSIPEVLSSIEISWIDDSPSFLMQSMLSAVPDIAMNSEYLLYPGVLQIIPQLLLASIFIFWWR